MLAENLVSVFFHMRNHYKKLRNVQSVIDCCPPDKGAKKVTKTTGRSKSASSRSPTSSSPPTKKTVKVVPAKDVKVKAVTKKSKNKTKSPRPQSLPPTDDKIIDIIDTTEHEFLHFSLRITEEIIKNDLYTNGEMIQVILSHYNANKNHLDEEGMRKTIFDLCNELNIPFNGNLDDFFAHKEELIKNVHFNTQSTICTPPACHDLERASQTLEVRFMQQFDSSESNKTDSSQVNNTTSSLEYIKLIEPSKIYSKTTELILLHKAEIENSSADEIGESIVQFQSANEKLLCNCSSEHCNRAYCTPNVTPVSTENKLCDCDSDSCDREHCTPIEKSIDVNLDEIVKKDKCTEVQQCIEEIRMDNKKMEKENVKFVLENKETSGNLCCDAKCNLNPNELPKDLPLCACSDNHEIKLQKYLNYYEKTMKHAENVRELNFSHQFTSIEPCKTADLAVQTSNVVIENASNASQTDRCIKELCTCPASSIQPKENCPTDYVLIEGPILVHKDTVKLNKEILDGRASHYEQKHPGYLVLSHTKAQNPPLESVFMRKLSAYQNHDYDLTPQKDYENKALAPSCHCDSSHDNLLLSNRYDRYQKVQKTLSAFYPTIATQVNSKELIDIKSPKYQSKINAEKEIIQDNS